MTKPRITLFSLGGTIAMSGDRGVGLRPALDADDLIGAVPELEGVARLHARTLRSEPSANLTATDIAELADEIETVVRAGADGVVITQGTDTLEECAFLLDLIIRADVPVVMTGAMRSPSLAGTDGPANLLSAVVAAGHGPLKDAGVVVVMNDQIHAAALVSKCHTADTGAFRSPSLGPIGFVHEGRVSLLTLPARMPHVPMPQGQSWPNVGLLSASLDDAEIVERWLQVGGLDGLIVEAFGAGHLSRRTAALVGEQAGRIPVILASRTGAGPVFTNTYGYEGAERDLIDRGLIPAGHLSGPKSRLLLALLLGNGKGRDDIRTTFNSLSTNLP